MSIFRTFDNAAAILLAALIALFFTECDGTNGGSLLTDDDADDDSVTQECVLEVTTPLPDADVSVVKAETWQEIASCNTPDCSMLVPAGPSLVVLGSGHDPDQVYCASEEFVLSPQTDPHQVTLTGGLAPSGVYDRYLDEAHTQYFAAFDVETSCYGDLFVNLVAPGAGNWRVDADQLTSDDGVTYGNISPDLNFTIYFQAGNTEYFVRQ